MWRGGGRRMEEQREGRWDLSFPAAQRVLLLHFHGISTWNKKIICVKTYLCEAIHFAAVRVKMGGTGRWVRDGEGSAAPPQPQQPPSDSRSASRAASALCCTSYSTALLSQTHEKPIPPLKNAESRKIPLLWRWEELFALWQSMKGEGFPHCQERSLRASRNKQEMLQHLSSRNRAPGQGCSSRIALVQPKEPDLCIKEYAGILHLQCWFKFISLWERNNLINVWLMWTALVAAETRVETHVFSCPSKCSQQNWESCGGLQGHSSVVTLCSGRVTFPGLAPSTCSWRELPCRTTPAQGTRASQRNKVTSARPSSKGNESTELCLLPFFISPFSPAASQGW